MVECVCVGGWVCCNGKDGSWLVLFGLKLVIFWFMFVLFEFCFEFFVILVSVLVVLLFVCVSLLVYILLIVYVSWYFFFGWCDMGIKFFDYLGVCLFYYWIVFDVWINVVGYILLGLLLVLVLYLYLCFWWVIWLVMLVGVLLLVCMEVV